MSAATNPPTVVLVDGGFADASYWVPAIERLQADNVPRGSPQLAPTPAPGAFHQGAAPLDTV